MPPTAPATINRRLAALRRFFTWAKENRLTDSQPTERIRNVEMVSQGPKSLDRKQWHRLERSAEQAKGIQCKIRVGNGSVSLYVNSSKVIE